ncbi:MAG: hypothetical protein AB8E82_14570 [Aureispira sp.]
MNKEELEKYIQTALEQKQKEQVETLAKEAVATYPEEPFGYAYLAEAMLLEFPVPYDKAELCIAKASQLAPENIQYLSSFANLKSKQGEKRVAQVFWSKVLLKDPSNIKALIAKGDYALNVTLNYSQALDFFNQAITQDINHVTSHFYRAKTFCKLKEYDKALKDYNHGVKLNDGVEDIRILKLKLGVFVGLDDKAAIADVYSDIVAMEPDNAYYYNLGAKHLVTLERYPEAAEYYSKAYELQEQQNIILVYEWGNVLEKVEQYEKALEVFGIYEQLSDDPIPALFKQINILIKIERNELALEKIAIAKKQNLPAIDEEKLILNEGKILFQLKQYQNAIDTLKVLLQNQQNLSIKDAAYIMGKSYFADGKRPYAYYFMRFAARGGHEEATVFLKEELHDYFNEYLQKYFEGIKVIIDKNVPSSLLQAIKGKVWSFQDIQGEALKDYDPELLSELKERRSNNMLLITEKAFFVLERTHSTLYTYNITQETANSIAFLVKDIHEISNGDVNWGAKLTLEDNGIMKYEDTQNEGNVMLFKECAPDDLTEEHKALLQKMIHQDIFAQLGSSVEDLAGHIWS